MDTLNRKTLTQAQSDVLEFIEQRTRDQGFPPSYREIQAYFNYKAVGTVQDHVRALTTKGFLAKRSGKERQARTLQVVGQSLKGAKRVPVYGEIAAGGPREAEQLELGSLVIDPALVKGDVFALRVVGDSMIDVGIFEGDLLVVQRTKRVRHGEIVVALLDGETTVKRYSDKKGEVQLLPENRKMGPISTRGKSLEIQGRVVGLQRKFQ